MPSTVKKPVVVLLGRTNAGKSTLFNRLTEHGKAIVSPAENTTRDQNRDEVFWKGAQCTLIDTGGLDMAAFDPLDQAIQQQVQRAVDQADAILFVVDGRGELMPQDRSVAQWLLKLGKPVILCINKADNQRWRQAATANFAKLNFSHTVLCSALNGSGTGDLLDVVFSVIPHAPAPEQLDTTQAIHVALVGQPNVGKSSLFNALIGEDRVIVSDLPHTTRDINDTDVIYQGKLFRLIDTAGIRRKNRVGSSGTSAVGKIERVSVQASLDMIDQADVVVLLLEAHKKINNQDKALLRYAQNHGKGLIVAINKWDIVPDKTPATINDYIKYFVIHLELPDYIPLIFISAKDKQRVTDVLDRAEEVYQYRRWYAPQEQLEAVLNSILKAGPKRREIRGQTLKKKPLIIESLKQIDINPPTFRIVSPHPKEVAPAIFHLIEKGIRQRCQFTGTPINLVVRNS